MVPSGCRRWRRSQGWQKRRYASPPAAQRRLRFWHSQRCVSAVGSGHGAAFAHTAVTAIVVAERAGCLSSPHPFPRLF